MLRLAADATAARARTAKKRMVTIRYGGSEEKGWGREAKGGCKKAKARERVLTLGELPWAVASEGLYIRRMEWQSRFPNDQMNGSLWDV